MVYGEKYVSRKGNKKQLLLVLALALLGAGGYWGYPYVAKLWRFDPGAMARKIRESQQRLKALSAEDKKEYLAQLRDKLGEKPTDHQSRLLLVELEQLNLPLRLFPMLQAITLQECGLLHLSQKQKERLDRGLNHLTRLNYYLQHGHSFDYPLYKVLLWHNLLYRRHGYFRRIGNGMLSAAPLRRLEPLEQGLLFRRLALIWAIQSANETAYHDLFASLLSSKLDDKKKAQLRRLQPFFQAFLLYREGKMAEARAQMRRYEEEKDWQQASLERMVWLFKIHLLFTSQEWQQAQRELQAFVAKWPQTSEGYRLYARLFQRLHKDEESRRMALKAKKLPAMDWQSLMGD